MRIGVIQHLAGDAVAALRRAGLRNTVRLIASSMRDAEFDRTYGTATAGYADPRAYASGDPRAERATFYVPTRARPFRAFLDRSAIDPTGSFVDFGCGKGRAMFVAAQYGFRSLTGIEFSPMLCRAAERNIERFQAHVPDTRFEIICGDAGDYQVRPHDSAFYFYDPFDDAAIDRCLARIGASVEDHPRRVSVIYHNSIVVRPTPFDRSDLLHEVPMPRFEGNAFYLFVNDVAPAAATAPRAALP